MSDREQLFPGFSVARCATAGADIHYLRGGRGPTLLLLHGYPQTHACWHQVAAGLAEHYDLVLPDLRGYGASRGPRPDPAHDGYSKRAMAADLIALMDALAVERFLLAGHDRGGRVAYRLALDHPQRVRRLAVLDIVPTLEMWDRWDRSLALATYHWTFLAQPPPVPERLIGADPGFYLQHLVSRWAAYPERIDPRAMTAYLRAFERADTIRASCEDYRAGATVDAEHDRADRDAGRRIRCPLLTLWGERGLAREASSPLAVWRRWAEAVSGEGIACGHFLMEEAPDETRRRLHAFFSSARGRAA